MPTGTCISGRPRGGVWPYDHTFRREVLDAEVAGYAHRACVQVSIRPFQPLCNDDRLLFRKPAVTIPPRKLKDVIAWVRLVIWENLDTGLRTPHLNVASNLPCLLAALIQPFTEGQGPCAYMIDYDADRIVFRQGPKPWPDPIPIPDELVSFPGANTPCQRKGKGRTV